MIACDRSTGIRLRGAALRALLFVGAAAAGLAPAVDGDVWWHLAAGREMVQTGKLLTTDPFSVTAGGRPWIDVHWLFQLALYGVHRLGGLTALVVAKCLIVAAGSLLLFEAQRRSPRHSGRALFVILFVAALFTVRPLLLVRPVIATLLFLGAFVLQLERFRREGRVATLLPLLPIQVVWTNCQGLSALGPALVVVYALSALAFTAFGDQRWFPFAPESASRSQGRRLVAPLLVASLVCVVGCCISPYGVDGLALPARLLGRLVPSAENPYAANVAENIPPFVLERSSPGQFWHLPWFLGLLASSFALSAGRPRMSNLLIVAGFVGLALMSNRNVLLLYWMVTPIIAANLAAVVRRATSLLRRGRGRWIVPSVAWTAAAALLLLEGAAAAREPTLAEPAPFRAPTGSANVIEQTAGQGAIFAADHQGGYLIWRLYPRFRPYIDTRLILRSPQEFVDYLRLADEPTRFDELQERVGFDYVVLPVAYPDRYWALIAHLYASPAWKVIFTDGAEVLFAPRASPTGDGWDLGSPTTTNRILAAAAARYVGSPRLLEAARLQIATLDIVVHAFGEAERALSEATSSAAEALRARCRFARGDLGGAEAIGLRLLDGNGDDVGSLDLMALIHTRRGDEREAVKFLERALAIDPFDGEATRLLAEMEEHQYEHRNPQN